MTGTCAFCGRLSEYLEHDHIVPRSLGGTNTSDNLQWLCPSCHRRKTREEAILYPVATRWMIRRQRRHPVLWLLGPVACTVTLSMILGILVILALIWLGLV